MTPARLAMIRTIAANCHASARQITGPTAEQLHAAGDVIAELVDAVTLLDRVRERFGDSGIYCAPNGPRTWAAYRPGIEPTEIVEGDTEEAALKAALEAPNV